MIIQNQRPTNNIKALITEPAYKGQVVFLEGDHKKEKTFERANIENADAVMILNDKLSIDASHADTEIILQAMLIKNTLL